MGTAILPAVIGAAAGAAGGGGYAGAIGGAIGGLMQSSQGTGAGGAGGGGGGANDAGGLLAKIWGRPQEKKGPSSLQKVLVETARAKGRGEKSIQIPYETLMDPDFAGTMPQPMNPKGQGAAVGGALAGPLAGAVRSIFGGGQDQQQPQGSAVPQAAATLSDQQLDPSQLAQILSIMQGAQNQPVDTSQQGLPGLGGSTSYDDYMATPAIPDYYGGQY